MSQEITKKKQRMMFTDLPEELKSEILSKVPATSLSQLWSTCKRWYALFKDPRLCKATTQVIFKKDYSVSLVNIGINNNPSFEFTSKLKSLKYDSKDEVIKINRIFHCDGLLLCTTGHNKPVVVCNPFTGQTRWIPPSYNGFSWVHEYVLGYDKSCHSYKILRLSSHINPLTNIYEFNSDSWRHRLNDDTDQEDLYYFRSSGVNLKGNTYWFASDVEYPPFVKFILKFDFEKEGFRRLSLPFQNDYVEETVVLSVVREEKLALLYQKFERNVTHLEMKIWITNTKIGDDEANDLSWSNFLVVDFGKSTKCMCSVLSFLVDEENKLVVCCDRYEDYYTRIYIVGEDIHKEVYKETTIESFPKTPLISYAPSLVQIQQK